MREFDGKVRRARLRSKPGNPGGPQLRGEARREFDEHPRVGFRWLARERGQHVVKDILVDDLLIKRTTISQMPLMHISRQGN
jgi:hypothetical protein